MARTRRTQHKPLKPSDVEVALKDCCHATIRGRKEHLARIGETQRMEQLPCADSGCRNILWYSGTRRRWEWFAYKRATNVHIS